MKSQDILLLLKLVSLHKDEQRLEKGHDTDWVTNWQDWELDEYRSAEEALLEAEMMNETSENFSMRYTARALEKETGISKSQINVSLNRCIDIGLAKKDRNSGVPRTNVQAFYGFIVHGLKYVFPVKPAEITRGIATAFAAPVLNKQLMSAGEWVPVWPDARGNTKGQAIEPLFKSTVVAVKKDAEMYALLALIDAIRIGQPREANLAAELLKQRMGIQS